MRKCYNILIPIMISFITLENRRVSLNKSKILITLVIYLCEFGINKLGIVNVEATTTLDFLFILYITGSMRPYLDEIKENIINIINGIIKESRN